MKINADPNEICQAVDYIRDTLKKRRIGRKTVVRATLSAEDVISSMIAHCDKPERQIDVRVISFLGNTEIRIACHGSAIDISEFQEAKVFGQEDTDEITGEALRSLYERLIKDRLSLRCWKGINIATIAVSKSKYRQLILTLCALVAGLLTGTILNSVMLPGNVIGFLTEDLFSPVSTMFLNALKMIVGPLVMFSIASSVAEFGDIKALGKIVIRIICSYMFTSFIAILLGILVWHVIPIGTPALQEAVDASAAADITGQSVSISIKDTIVGIIPKDVVSPFLNANMLQIIFMSILLGIAVGLLSGKLQVMKSFLTDGYQVLSRITKMIIGVMPLAIFCSMAKMVLAMNLGTLLSVVTWVPVCYAGCLLMIAVYGLLILIFGRMNPLPFYRKYYPAMLTAYTFSSSNAALPTSMEYCEKALGISKKVYTISLPLGATINMDGSCVVLCISALFMTKVFGIPVTPGLLTTLALSVFVLSIGAPGVPGAALICMSILFPQIGIPAEAVSLLMGLYALVGMIMTCTNVTGDAAVTLVTAKHEKLLDMDVYKS